MNAIQPDPTKADQADQPKAGQAKADKAKTGTGITDDWGRVLVTADEVFDLIYREIDPQTLSVIDDERLAQYNHWCDSFNKKQHVIHKAVTPACSPAEEHARRSATWFIPDAYRKLDVRATLLDRCAHDNERNRVHMEMDLFEARGLIPLLQLMFALVADFRARNIVWGVGRGSSCASYCLFLIGVHKIDAIRFGLEISEFLK